MFFVVLNAFRKRLAIIEQSIFLFKFLLIRDFRFVNIFVSKTNNITLDALLLHTV